VIAALLAGATAALAADEQPIVNDVSQLNPIAVERIVSPKSVDEIQTVVRDHDGPISIGGARHSMGGQIATEGAFFVDMRSLDRILALDLEKKTITVEAGITWRKIQEAIDPKGLAVKVMQSYSNFTVGGSLSVNAHGRYVGQGSLIASVRSIRMVLSDGSVATASRTENSDLFYGAIGGYGALGVIVEATLDLVDNVRMARDVKVLPVTEYRNFFDDHIRHSKRAVFHNADLYPPDYDSVVAITWSETSEPPTVEDRLTTVGGSHWKDQLAYWWISEVPYGKEARVKLIDPMRLKGRPVVWRNYEASYDVGELEPGSRKKSTYVLEEYFVPVDRFDDFVPKLREVFLRHHPNILNVSIRHAEKDSESIMAWARQDTFAFVIYYKQCTMPEAKTKVGEWTRELIDVALSVGGTYYLPYQLHATDEQFHRAYPDAERFFELKQRYDPDYRFRNKLWDRYYRPVAAAPEPKTPPPAPAASDEEIRAKLRARTGYVRDGGQTFLTLPEWYIVYSADELAAFVHDHRPSGFPYFRSIAQFWRIYAHVVRETWGSNWGYQLMLCVIGPSYSLEYLVQGIYENLLGRFSELTVAPRGAWKSMTPEDEVIEKYQRDYASFMHSRPWFEFSFAERLRDLWRVHGPKDRTIVRRGERRLGYSGLLAFKTAWGGLIGVANRSTYDPEAETILAWARKGADPASEPRVLAREDLGDSELLTLPRYEPFTAALVSLASHGVRLVEIAGNSRILVTVIAPADWHDERNRGEELLEWPILTQREKKRVALVVDVARLHEVLPSFAEEKVAIDHVYDF
jgi:FAD/FMN-containing dehydrogenase